MPQTHSPLLGLSERQPPHNIQAEQALLGGLLANNKALDRIEEFLRPLHFVDAVHGEIYAAIVGLVSRGRLADLVTLKAEFEFSQRLAEIGGTEYLASLATAMVAPMIVAEYARAILDAWMRREIIDAASAAMEAAFVPPDGGAPAILEELDARTLKVVEGAGDVSPLVPVGDALREAIQGAEEAARRGTGLAGVTTGYCALDRMTTGLLPSAYVVLAARPSVGKTALGLAIATRTAAAGNRVLFWSGEMSALQLGARQAAAKAWLPTTSVFTGLGYDTPEDGENQRARALQDWEWRDLDRAERSARHLKLWIDARPGITVAALRARARRMKRGAGLDLIVLDYLSLMRGTEESRRRGRYEEVTEISASIKMMAKELNLPVLVLAQLNRESEKREDKRPSLVDLRDSGAVEQDADAVIFLHRPHYHLSRQGKQERKFKESDEDYANRLSDAERRLAASIGVAEINVAKNRHGPTGMTRLRFVDRTTWFFDESEPERGDAWPDMAEGI